MTPGDFFGEIAALTGGSPHCGCGGRREHQPAADTCAGPAQLDGQPGPERALPGQDDRASQPHHINELPRFAGVDQQDARELRTVPAEE